MEKMATATTVLSSRCPICGDIRVVEVHRYEEHPVMRCTTCQFDFLLENLAIQIGLSKVESSVTPVAVVEGYLSNVTADIEVAKESISLRLPIFEAVADRQIKRVLEIGCSIGNGFYAFRDHGIDWIGLETNPRWIEYGKKHSIPICETELTALENTFDLIYFHQVLEHIWDPGPFMQACFDRLNPGGVLHIAVPNHAGFTSLLRRAMPRMVPTEFGMIQFPHHLRAYSPKSLSRLFEISGFTPIDVHGIRHTDPCWGEWFARRGSLLNQAIFFAGGLIGLGTLLYGYAKKPN